MSPHTPSPWSIATDRISPPEIIAVGIFDICTLAGAASNGSVMADARLIAAAPDLLAACESYLQDRAEAGCTADSAAVKAMRAAVAKATGEQNVR